VGTSLPHEQRVGWCGLLSRLGVLDKATSALDEDMEKQIYTLLAERLPRMTVVSVAHRPEVADYHRRRWTFVPDPRGRLRTA
jgi:putative ATP-binding cassette transporter